MVAISASCDLQIASIDAGRVQAGVVELGTGVTEFETMLPDQELGLIAGPQGGHHFIVNARMQMLDPGIADQPVTTPRTTFSVFDESGVQIDLGNPPWRIAYEPKGSGWYGLPGGKICQVFNEVVPAIYGTRVRLELEIVDNQGRFNVDDRWVMVFDACKRDPDLCLGAP